MLKHIDAILQDWIEFHVRMFESSGIGFPNKSPLAALIDYRTRTDNRPAGCVVPFLRNTPHSVQRIDQVLRVLPDTWLDVLAEHYIQPRPGAGM